MVVVVFEVVVVAFDVVEVVLEVVVVVLLVLVDPESEPSTGHKDFHGLT